MPDRQAVVETVHQELVSGSSADCTVAALQIVSGISLVAAVGTWPNAPAVAIHPSRAAPLRTGRYPMDLFARLQLPGSRTHDRIVLVGRAFVSC